MVFAGQVKGMECHDEGYTEFYVYKGEENGLLSARNDVQRRSSYGQMQVSLTA